jgi:hypothetical protein
VADAAGVGEAADAGVASAAVAAAETAGEGLTSAALELISYANKTIAAAPRRSNGRLKIEEFNIFRKRVLTVG